MKLHHYFNTNVTVQQMYTVFCVALLLPGVNFTQVFKMKCALGPWSIICSKRKEMGTREPASGRFLWESLDETHRWGQYWRKGGSSGLQASHSLLSLHCGTTEETHTHTYIRPWHIYHLCVTHWAQYCFCMCRKCSHRYATLYTYTQKVFTYTTWLIVIIFSFEKIFFQVSIL